MTRPCDSNHRHRHHHGREIPPEAGVSGALGHVAVIPLAAATTPSARVLRGVGGSAALGMAGLDTFIGYKVAADPHASIEKKLIAGATVVADTAAAIAAFKGTPWALLPGVLALGAGIWRDRMD